MKNLFLITLITITLSSCNHQQRQRPLNSREKLLCGRWMTKIGQYNREKYFFKSDGTFTDADADAQNSSGPFSSTTELWEINNQQLQLKYKLIFIYIPLHTNTSYRIITLTDSTLVLTRRGTKRYPASILSFRKMKLNGKFIRG